MYWILMVMALLVSIVLAIIVGGLATPRKHVASRTIMLSASPETVWGVVRDVANYASWRADVQSVHVDANATGATRWTELGDNGSVSYVAATDEPPVRFTARITDEDLSYTGEWQYALVRNDIGTRLTISEHGEVGNPIYRFFGTHFSGFTRRMDTCLQNLADHLHESAKPEAATA